MAGSVLKAIVKNPILYIHFRRLVSYCILYVSRDEKKSLFPVADNTGAISLVLCCIRAADLGTASPEFGHEDEGGLNLKTHH